MKNVAENADIPLSTAGVGGMFGLYFTEAGPIKSYDDAIACDSKRFSQFFHGMLEKGVYFAPSSFEAGFISITHSENDIADTIEKAEEVMQSL